MNTPNANSTIWIHHARARSSWYELDAEAKTTYAERWRAIDAAAIANGATSTGSHTVRGQSDYSTVEVWTFDSYDAAYDFWEQKVTAEYGRWFVFANSVGAKADT
ncbi:hypothetical protein EEB13_30265 [Rhodococcus sp. WS3]|uniref:hypothetical protein n=1 Tax=unclassified Rhodococcus (in: high G+C Gram-positive bacteria) TaxID=192944 RepID=UPI0005D2F086|nr:MULTISPECIES: hypothetical protein [unclassified Rhodococcus (in: high G+C Gram-positive bacteria)]KJF19301.1 hypothetical protein SZ00_06228 [Rhodococcus sp. AD45]ROZ42743.1 hypothetical protein EEB13_30265 [Rhodococcus sp. WS3]RZL21770.1 MAG: hypothetical protein EOP31_26080 [Rhodococcus sp. (in: high G+C Gram-positive bacteria)]